MWERKGRELGALHKQSEQVGYKLFFDHIKKADISNRTHILKIVVKLIIMANFP